LLGALYECVREPATFELPHFAPQHFVIDLGDVVEDRSAESPFEVAATALLPEEITRLLAPLDEREREILALRFGLDRGEPRTLEEVGEAFNLTRERIRQIEARAMSKLRHPSSDTGARDLLSV